VSFHIVSNALKIFDSIDLIVQWAAKVMTPVSMYFLWKQGAS